MRGSFLLGLCSLTAALAQQQQHPIGISPATPSAEDAPSYRSSLLSLHKTLVSVPSTSGTEQAVGEVLIDYLKSKGYIVHKQPLPQSDTSTAHPRFNVLAWRKATDLEIRSDRYRLLVTSHIDAVPPHIPYSISDKRPTLDTVISGRGSVDDKASIAAQIIALEELRAAHEIRDDDAMLLFVVGEETVGDGMRHFSAEFIKKNGGSFDAVIFGEPTEGKLACGHKGHAGCTITAKGKAGHSGYPWLGKSATEVIARVLVKIMDADLGSSERYGNTTVNIGVVQGGVAANVIAQRASAKVAFRLAAGDQATGWDEVRGRLEGILGEVDEELSMDCTNGYGPVECYCDVEGFDTIVVNYGTDAANLEGDHVRYLYGPGSILVAHGDNEAITVGDLEAAVEGYKTLIKHALTYQ